MSSLKILRAALALSALPLAGTGRATTSRVGVRGMDRGSRGDQGQASEEAEV